MTHDNDAWLMELRRKAEGALRDADAETGDRTPDDLRQMIHDLRVYQIELELQNEELRRTRVVLEETREEATRARDRFIHLYDDAPVGYITVDSSSIIRQCNRTFLDLLGMSEKQVLKKTLTTFVDTRDRDVFDLRFAAFFKAPAGKSLDIRLVPREGTPFHVELEGRREVSADAPVVAVGTENLLIIVHDIQVRKAAEIKLEAALARVRESNRDLEQFAHAVSHDLREPLRMISQYLQLISRRYGEHLDAEGGEYLGFAVDGAQRMDGMIEEILAFSRIGRDTAPIGNVDMNSVVGEVRDILKRAVEARAAHLVTGPLPTVQANHAQIVSLMQNLIGNALKYCPEDRRPVIRISATRSGPEDGWTFCVSDNGIGIESAYHERIFTMFQRLHGRSDYDGAGIGLALCRRIVERHRGRIWVESAPSSGSSFFFTIP